MKSEHTYGLWGFGIGAVVAMGIGFTWGGWSTAASVKQQVAAAQSDVYVQVCADRMMSDPAAVALIKTKKPTDYDDAVRDTRKEWKPSGYEFPTVFSFNRECGAAVAKLMTKTAAK